MASSSFRSGCFLLCFAISSQAGKAQVPNTGTPEERHHRFSWQHLNPPELQFGCLGTSDQEENKLAEQLAKGKPHEQLGAARALWEGHSRRQASNILKYLAGPPPGGEEYRKFQREVEASLQPQAILRELKEGDYMWGSWLAFLRPNEQLVPTLLDTLKEKPAPGAAPGAKDFLRKFPSETMLALGNSGDPLALKPLSELLKSNQDGMDGFAAQALGYLGNPQAEPMLIEALSRDKDNVWLQVNACVALGMMGSARALPALQKLAKDDRYIGALNVKGCAKRAIERITDRQKP